MIRLARALACVLLAAASAQAQLTTSRVNVLITGARCGELQNVFLVIDGEDLEDQWIRLEKKDGCHWTADLGEDGSLSTALSRFSLRVDLARTDCRQAAANEEEAVAELEFACCRDEPLRNVRVKTQPPMPVSYVRNVPRDRRARVRGVDCVETGAFLSGTGMIRHTQFSGEDVYLQLGTPVAKPRMLGLLLDDVVANGGAMALTRDGVAYRLIAQRAQGKARSAPTLSSNAIALDIKRLTELKLERAEMEVIQ